MLFAQQNTIKTAFRFSRIDFYFVTAFYSLYDICMADIKAFFDKMPSVCISAICGRLLRTLLLTWISWMLLEDMFSSRYRRFSQIFSRYVYFWHIFSLLLRQIIKRNEWEIWKSLKIHHRQEKLEESARFLPKSLAVNRIFPTFVVAMRQSRWKSSLEVATMQKQDNLVDTNKQIVL